MSQNNNIKNLTFDNHDTYIYYVDEVIKSAQQVTLTPTNSEDTDIVRYISQEVNLYTNGIKNGIIKFNTFDRFVLNLNIIIGTTIITIITNDGILMGNFGSERNSLGLTISRRKIKTLATYKSDKYANYINVEIQIDFEDGYRIVTISY